MRDSRSLVGAHRRPDLEHLPAEARHEAFPPRALGHLLEVGEGGFLVLGLPVVKGDRQPLVLHGPVDPGREGLDPLAPVRRFGLELQPVRTDVADAVDADEPPGVLAGPAADARDERVASGEPRDLGPGLLRDACAVGSRGDRRERAVDVEQDRGALGRLGQGGERIGMHAP